MKAHALLITTTAAAMALSGLVSCQPEAESTSVEAEQANPGAQLVADSIAAHGGTERWYENGQLQFRWKYNMRDKGVTVDTTQTFDPTTMSVVHEVQDSEIRFGMNGGTAWITPENAEFTPPPRFWALTPVYFLGIPFVFNDEGARFEQLTETMAFEGKDYTQVKVTYGENSGDSPDDYYVLLIDPETKLTRGAYYTVTNPLVLNGEAPGPAKFITLDDLQDVSGLKLASGHRTFKMEDGEIGEIMRDTEVSGVKFLPEDTVDLSIPSGAKTL